MYVRNHGRTVFALTSLFAATGIGSYLIARAVIPSLLPYVAYVLVAVLGGWAATCTGVLLSGTRAPIRWLAGCLLVVAGLAGVLIPQSGMAGVLLIPLALAMLVMALVGLALLRLRRRSSARPLLLGFVPLLAAVLMLGGANLRWATPPVPSAAMSVRDELRAIHDLDQQDRWTGRAFLDATRDRARLERVLALDRQGLIVEPEAQYHAALVLQHGSCPDHFRRAYELFSAAAQAHVPDPQELWKAAYDRWMLSEGKPQKYGTQLIVSQAPACEDHPGDNRGPNHR